jgi:hypothetical protein
MNASGSSGLFAVKVALEAGAERVVLAGVPLVASARHVERPVGPWHERDSFVDAWHIAEPHIAGRVKSMSGWTREFLGSVTEDWLAGGER